jgi:hypothetical protein
MNKQEMWLSLADCPRGLTCQYYETREEAEIAKNMIDNGGCSGVCTRNHWIEEVPEPLGRGVRVTFGKHAGKTWAQIPASYLAWIIRTRDHRCRQTALAEVARRQLFHVDIAPYYPGRGY